MNDAEMLVAQNPRDELLVKMEQMAQELKEKMQRQSRQARLDRYKNAFFEMIKDLFHVNTDFVRTLSHEQVSLLDEMMTQRARRTVKMWLGANAAIALGTGLCGVLIDPVWLLVYVPQLVIFGVCCSESLSLSFLSARKALEPHERSIVYENFSERNDTDKKGEKDE